MKDKIIDEIMGKIRKTLEARKSPLACEYYMCPAVAVDPNRNLALIVEEYQEVHSELRLTEVRYEIFLYDFKRDRIARHIKNYSEKTGPGAGIGTGTYWVAEFKPVYNKQTGKLCLITERMMCNSGDMRVLKKEKEEKEFF